MIRKIIFFTFFIIANYTIAQTSKHKVVQGDTPYNISQKYGLTLDELLDLNPQIVGGKIKIGDQLFVRAKASKTVQESNSFITSDNDFIILKPKQTLYGVSKQYKVGIDEIKKLNPNLEMKIGEKVFLPAQNVKKHADKDAQNTQYLPTTSSTNKGNDIKIQEENKTSTVQSRDDYQYYTVTQGDTTFGITNQNSITLDELIALNPEVKEGLKTNMVLKLKKKEVIFKKKTEGLLNVVLMLPFGFDENETKFRSMATEFLSGAKIAIERNVKMGQKLQINVIDAGSESSFKKSLIQLNKENTDLIIGPFQKSNILEVLNFVQDKKIPVVAPFANAPELNEYSNLIIIETNELVFADRIVSEIKDDFNDQKIYVVANKNEKFGNYISSELQNKISNPNIQIVSSPNEIQLEINPMTGLKTPVVAILAEENDKTANEFAKKVIELSKEMQGLKSYSMFYSSIFDKMSDELSTANLVYIMDRKVNTDGEFEREILGDFNEKYCKTPSKYAMIGFDVVNDMLSRENSKGEIFNQILKPQTQLATKFEFKRASNNGAYINTGHRVVRLKSSL